ncbi:uncharacterized protein METZ01_LOCUS341408 [marine metagenome]|uniref:Uncharacterized protein n=1 Tax=marine metagenome TaxID=408172 RepID=A0A382QSR5_9ZZZZ
MVIWLAGIRLRQHIFRQTAKKLHDWYGYHHKETRWKG